MINWPSKSIHYTSSAKVIKVIEVKTLTGQGTKENPRRTVIQYWSLDGEFLADDDRPLLQEKE